MKKTYNTIVFAFICLFLTLYIIMCIFVHPIRKSPTHNKIEITTDTIIIRDTIIIEDIKPITEIKYKDKFITDTVFVDNTPIVADIPFEEKEYQDTNYYIKISGFEPNIDELKIYQNEKIITNTITKYKNDYSRHSIGLNIGASAIWIDGKPEIVPTISVGWNIDLIRWRRK